MHVVCNVLMKLDTHHPDHHAPTLSLSLSLTLSAYKNQYREREREILLKHALDKKASPLTKISISHNLPVWPRELFCLGTESLRVTHLKNTKPRDLHLPQENP